MKSNKYSPVCILIWCIYPTILFIVIVCMFFTCTNKGLRTQSAPTQTEHRESIENKEHIAE